MTEVREHPADKNCLSYWFPLIRDAGLPVPRTGIVTTDVALWELLDGKSPVGWERLYRELDWWADEFGYPVFLRTGHGSGKHEWEKTCFVPSKADLPAHVAALVQWSECIDFMGLPYDVWAVREMLPTNPVCVLPAYGNMPLCREFRCFVRDGEVLCVHPYWPWEAVRKGFPPKMLDDCDLGEEVDAVYDRQLPDGLKQKWGVLCSMMSAEEQEIERLASRAGKAVGGGYWSVDILETTRGWYVTDMALGEQSFHWPGCKNAKAD